MRVFERALRALMIGIAISSACSSGEVKAEEAASTETQGDLATRVERLEKKVDEQARQGGQPAPAELPNKLWIDGFGSWAYGRTNGNNYSVGRDRGNYKNSLYSLNVNAAPSPKLRISAQLFSETTDEEVHTSLDYAFAEWSFSDGFRFRVGQVKQPFGIYTEVFDVGTLRPFFTLPQSIYGPLGFVSESYMGVGVTGTRYNISHWGLGYDLYGGYLETENDSPAKVFGGGALTEQVSDLVGGRITLYAPLSDLSFGLSGYSGKRNGETAAAAHGRLYTYGVHLEYLSSFLSIRSEYAYRHDLSKARISGFYFEAAEMLTRKWQVAGRYESADVDLPNFDLGSMPSLLNHREWAAGLNYWFNTNFVLKLSYHIVNGNLLARPTDRDNVIVNGTLEKRTNLIVFGAQFSF